MSVLGLSAWRRRLRATLAEVNIAFNDRAQLAALEWEQEKKRLQTLLVLAVAVVAIGAVALLLLSLALLVQFWDSPHRSVVAWVITGVWFFAWAVVIYALLSALRQKRQMFALTRSELQRDWQELKASKQK